MIREAKINDVNSITSVILNSWLTAYEGIIDPNYLLTLNEDKFIKIFKKNINNNLEKIFLYEKNSKIIGFISGLLKDTEYDCEIIGFYILPDFQNKGIGKKLFNKMIDYFKENKCKNLIVWTLKNARNNMFYKKMGGIEKENKEIILGNKKYNGIGFVYYLAFIPAKPNKRFERNL